MSHCGDVQVGKVFDEEICEYIDFDEVVIREWYYQI